MRHFDAFTGYGGFTIAADRLGIKTVGASEIDQFACAVYQFNWPGVENYGDINSITIKELPDFDILTGGFPCQDLSVAGRRRGLSGTRSGLFFRWRDILKARTPEYFILENVKGLLSSNGGWDFAILLNEVAQSGYDVQWAVVNANVFVPQNRERVFIVGHLRGGPRRTVFPIEGTDKEVRRCGEDISFCLDANYWKGISPSGYQSKRRQLINESEGKGLTYKQLLEDPEQEVRRLTPVECERLMGVTENYTKWGMLNTRVSPISDTQRYKMLGNGVVPAVVEEILGRLVYGCT